MVVVAAIPGFVELRIAESKITTQIDQAIADLLHLRQSALCHAMGQGQKQHITGFERRHAGEL